MLPRMVYPHPKGRRPQKEDRVTFKTNYDLKVPNYVQGFARDKSVPCLLDLSLLFSCMKENSFEDNMCKDEIQKYHECIVLHKKETQQIKERQKNPQSVVGVPLSKMTLTEINQIMKKFK